MSAKFISALRGYIRLTKSPLDASSIHGSYNDALNYVLTDPTAYAGQFLAVVDDTGKVTSYVVSEDSGELKLNELLQGDSQQFQQLYELLEEMTQIFDHFTFEGERIIIDTPLQVDRIAVNTDAISYDDDVITVSYLADKLSSIPKGIEVFSGIINNTGGDTFLFDVPVFLDKISVVVQQDYQSPLSIYFGNDLLVHSDYVQETVYPGDTESMTIIEINKQFSQIDRIRIVPDYLSATGSGYFSITFKR